MIMDGVTPVGGNSPISPSGPTSSSTPVGTVNFRDSIQSAANGTQVFQSLLSFMNLVGTTSNELQETITLSNEAKASSRIPFYQAMAKEGLTGVAYLAFLKTYETSGTALYASDQNAISSLNTSLTTYNNNISNDYTAVLNMNTAIQDYQDGNITEAQYNQAVDTYNAYVANQNIIANSANSAIDAYNTEIANLNSQIDDFNSSTPTGLTSLSHETIYAPVETLSTLPSAPPIPTSSISYTANALTATSQLAPSLQQFTQDIQSLIYDTALALFTFTMTLGLKRLKQLSKYAFSQIFNLAGQATNLPAAYLLPPPKTNVSDPSAPGGSGSSIPLALSTGTLSSSTINDALEHSIFMTDLQSVILKQLGTNNNQLLVGLNLSISELVSRIGLLAVNTAVQLLGTAGSPASVDPRSPIASVAVSAGVLNELTAVISAGVIKDTVVDALRSLYPNIPGGKLNKLAKALVASTELILLLSGTLNLAAALNSPKLVGQLLSTISSEGIIGLLSSAPPFSNFLNNPSLQLNLAASLAKETQLSDQTARAIVADAASKEAVNTDIFQINLSAALQAKGIAIDEANKAASTVIENLKPDLVSEGLLARTVTQASIAGTPLESAGVMAILNQNNNNPISVKDLRQELIRDLRSSGLSQRDARLAATALVSTLDITFARPTTDDLKTIVENQTSILAQQQHINKNTINIMAKELSSLLLGTSLNADNKSVRDLLADRITTLQNIKDKNISAQLEESFKDYITPEMVTVGLAKLLGDPATSLLYLASGLIYTPDQSPSKPGSVSGQRPGGIDMPV